MKATSTHDEATLRQQAEAGLHEKLKADAFDFMVKNDDLEAFVDFFSERVLELYGCDQVIYRDVEGRMILKDRPGAPALDFSLCKDCRHYAFDEPVYADGFTAMDDCSVGWKGIPVHPDCPVRASLTYIVHVDGGVFGYIALHYLGHTHRFTDDEKNTFDRLAKFLSVILSRQKQQDALRDSMVFSNYFIESFVSTYLVNLDTCACKVYTRTEDLARRYPVTANYYESLKNYAARDVHPDDRARFLEFLAPDNLKQALAGRKTVLHQYRDVSGGEEKTYVVRVVRGSDENYAALAFADITGQIKTRREATRNEASAMLSLLEDLDSVFLVDHETGAYSIFLPGADSIEHYTTMKREGNNFYDDIPVQARTVIHEEDRAQFLAFYSRENLRKIAETGEPQEIVNRWFVKEGLRIIRNKIVRRVDADGKTTLILGVWDLTDEIARAQAAQQGRMLQTFGDMMNAATWSMKIQGADEVSAIHWSDELRHMFGFEDKEDFPETLEAWTERLHPEDSGRVLENFSRGVKEMDSGRVYDVEYRFRHKDGEYRWYHAYGRIEKNSEGERTYYGIVVDISAEKALSQRNERFEVVKNLIHAGLWCFKLNAKDEITGAEFSDDIPAIVNTDKLTRNDYHNWRAIVHPDDVKAAAAAFDAAVADHTGNTVYDVNYRMIDRNGNYNWFHSAGKVIRHEDGTGDFYGIHININDQMEEQKRRMLGAVPLSPDVLAKANIGLWAFELDEGQPPRMYHDETMLGLVGLDHQLPPEEAYHAWYDHVDKDSYQIVHDAVAKMMAGEHAEVQYPWHHPDGHTIIVRCGGIRNLGYTKGIRVEGTHQNVSEVLHYDDEEMKRLKARETELMHAEFRASAIAYLTEHEGDVKSFLNYFAARLRELIRCDQVIYQGPDGEDTVNSAPEFSDIVFDADVCKRCPHNDYRSPVYAKGVTEMADNQKGFEGVCVPKECPVKSSLTRIVYLDGKPNGYLAIHYISDYHAFTDYERRTLEEFTNLLSISLSRFAAREKTAELERELQLQRQIAEQKERLERQQKQLEEALSMAQSANRAKTMFLNNMSHDIRTPMNAIIGFTGLAASHLDSKALVKDYLGKISQSSDHLLSLINDVLDMARIESGKMNLTEKQESLPEIIHSLRNIIQTQISDKQLDFFIDCCDVKDENIVCDKLRLSQVFLNILSNAIKYTPTGGTVSLRIAEVGRAACPLAAVSGDGAESFADGRAVCPHTAAGGENGANGGVGHTALPGGGAPRARYVFTFKDNGVGMSAEFLKEVFDPFSRAKNTTASGVQGTGLGMAITKNIVDMMGGEIDVKSEVGKGTEVTITLDFALGEDVEQNPRIEELAGLKALVADDDVNSCLSVSATLKEIGMRPEWCTSGKEAVIRAKTAFGDGEAFRVYIIDWLMPDMNGVETVRRIRKVIGKDMPIIILTAYDWSDIEAEAIEAGVTAFISKPLFASELRKILVEQIGNDGRAACPHAAASGENEANGGVGHTALPGGDATLNSPVRHILLVEDNEINREIAVMILTEQGFDVDTAENGEQAVMKVKETNAPGASFPYDFVLMDIQMPVMNGYQATKAIREWEKGKLGMRNEELGIRKGESGNSIPNSEFLIPNSHLPIVALSANAFAEDVAASIEAGMDGHLSKPIKVRELMAAIDKFKVKS